MMCYYVKHQFSIEVLLPLICVPQTQEPLIMGTITLPLYM